jgi:rhodanese-related sulfurtransferase/cytochrome c553
MRFQLALSTRFLVIVLASNPVAVVAADGAAANGVAAPASGQELFEEHGCTNCHGKDGIHPESKYVPILRGKSSDYLYRHATDIFAGEEASDKTVFMHEQFCIGAVQEEGCYPPPSAEDLRVIADWLGNDGVGGKKKTPQGLYVTAVQAHEQLQNLGSKALFIDVRTRAEVNFLGMPDGTDANIPYMTVGSFDEWDEKKQRFKLRPNSEFTTRVNALVEQRGMDKETPIYLICRSGSRSAKAANILSLAGYSRIYVVTDGFEGDKAKAGPRKGERIVNGWKNAGLPWSYKLDKSAMYWDF